MQTIVIDIVGRFVDQTSHGLQKAKGCSDKLGESLKKTQEQADRLSGKKSELSIKDKATQAIEKVNKGLKSITQKAWNITINTFDKATAPIRGIFNLIKNPLTLTISVLGLGMSASNIFETFTGFEKSMSNVQALTKANAKQMEQMTAKAREMGKSTTKSASEAADAFGYMALAGWDTDTMLTAIEPTLRLSEAGDMELGRTSDLVTDSMSSLGLQADELEGYLDKVAKTASKSNTDIDQLMESFLEIGGTVKQNNIPLEEANGLIGVFANRGVKGSEAGVALNSVLVNLTTGAGQAGKAMKELGLSAFNSDGSFKGYAQTLKELNEKTKDMTDRQKSYYLSAIGGKMRISDLQKLLAGVSEEYDQLKDSIIDSKGALEEMAKTKNDNIYGDIKALQSAFDDIKIGFMSKLQPYIRKFIQWFTGKMPDINKTVEGTADFFIEKIVKIKKTINEFTSSNEWENADFFGKVKIAWDNIVAKPFDKWWNSSGKQWASDKANGMGKAIGKGLSTGLLTLLGFDVQSAVGDGINIGLAFAEGFMEGFDAEKIGKAILNAIKGVIKDAGTLLPGGEEASNTSVLSAAVLSIAGFKVAKKGYGMYKGASTLYKGASSLFGKKKSNNDIASMVEKVSATNMTVSSNIVNVYGGVVNNRGKGAASQIGKTAAGHAIGKIAGNEAAKLITKGAVSIAVKRGGQALLTGAVKGGGILATGGGLTSATGWLGTLLQTGSSSSIIGADETLISVTGGVGGTLGSVGTSLGSGAATAAGTAAAGALSIVGGVLGLIGLGDGIADIFQATKKEGKEAKDKYFKGGTKIGMVGTGAAVGAAIGSVVPVVGTGVGALIGAGVGGLGALFEGDDVGKWLSDSTDEGGWLSDLGESIGEFFTEKIPKWLGELTDSVSLFFTETIPEKWNNFWDMIGNFFTKEIPYAVGYAIGKIEAFFTEDIPDFFSGLWDSISGFFIKTLPEVALNIWDSIKSFFTETIPNFFGSLWDSVKGMFGAGYNDAKNGSEYGTSKHVVTDSNSSMLVLPAWMHAKGGIMTEPHIGLVGEAGPEAIIPLSGTNKEHGVRLWEQTGEILGLIPKHAKGGIFGNIINKSDENETFGNNTSLSAPVTVNLGGVTITINASGGDNGRDVMEIIRKNMPEISNDVADAIAKALLKLFPNMKAGII